MGLRDYMFANGLEGKVESTLSLGKYATVALVYNHFWLRTFEGPAGSNSVGIFRPRATVRLFKNVSLGYEHFAYSTNRTLRNFADQNVAFTDQKFFIQLFLEDPQRRGRFQ